MEGIVARKWVLRASQREMRSQWPLVVALLHERTETDEKWEVRYEVEMLRRWTYRPSLHLYQVLY